MAFVGLLQYSALAVLILQILRPSLASVAPVVVEKQLLWQGGSTAEVAAFRIPIITNTPDGGLLIVAESRKFSGSDAGAKFLTLRRSIDGGSSWSPVELLVEDFQTVDGLNVAHRCFNKQPFSERGSLGLRTRYGIQLTKGKQKGRLVACGHLISDYGSREGLYCLKSDDHGNTWEVGASIPGIPDYSAKKVGDFALSEPQIVELQNGSLLCFTRNTYAYHCNCKVVSRSDDQGDTFLQKSIRFDDILVDPGCAGSALMHKGVLYHLNPNSAKSRDNLTLRWSEDEGQTWKGSLAIDPGSSGYSCLSAIDDNHIGLAYETRGYRDITFVRVRLHP
ncbi:sialidase-1-like [Ptychodera flava]|uniref:sialidase-1-like n=1 Tax=Ptychodera flava TaxID=63121 RepID=UPI00396A302E